MIFCLEKEIEGFLKTRLEKLVNIAAVLRKIDLKKEENEEEEHFVFFFFFLK